MGKIKSIKADGGSWKKHNKSVFENKSLTRKKEQNYKEGMETENSVKKSNIRKDEAEENIFYEINSKGQKKENNTTNDGQMAENSTGKNGQKNGNDGQHNDSNGRKDDTNNGQDNTNSGKDNGNDEQQNCTNGQENPKTLDTNPNENSDNVREDQNMRKLDVDDFLEEVGGFGIAQKAVLLFIYFNLIPNTYHVFSWHFNGLSPAWRCTQNSGECNVTGVFDLGDKMYESRCAMERSSWEFVEDRDFSIVTEWDLVCDKKEYPFTSTSLMWIGWAVGSFLFGFVSDKYGRKNTLFFSMFLMLTSTIACAFIKWFWVYAAFAFLSGFAHGGSSLGIFILASELVVPKYKSLASGAGTGLTLTISRCLLSLQAWLTQKWRLFMIVTTAPYFVLFLFYKVMPESVRWLRLKSRSDEAEGILRKFCKVNKRKWPSNTCLSHPFKKDCNDSLGDLFKEKVVAMNMIILMFIWFVIGQVFFGISMASDQLSGNVYRDFALTSMVGIPANFLVVLLTNKFGRKPTMIASLGTSSLACVGIACIDPKSNYVWARLTLGMIGELCMALSFSSIYIWSMELMPTSVRSKGMGVLSVVTRIGGSSAPWVAQWLEHVHWSLPFAVMAAFALLSSIACSRLPETNHVPTIETIQDLMRLAEGNSGKTGGEKVHVKEVTMA